MDPMDYILSNNHHRPSGHYDPVHSASSHWAPHSHSHNPALHTRQIQNSSLPHLYSHQYAGGSAPSSGPDPYGHHGAMLPPLLGLPGSGPLPGSMPGPTSPRQNGRLPSYRNSMPVAAAPIPSGTGNHSYDAAFANQIPVGRPADFQPPVLGFGMPPLGPGQEVNSLQRSTYAQPDTGANSLSQNNNNYFPHFVATPLSPHPYISTPTRRGHFSSSSVSSRPFGGIPSPTRPSPPSSGFRRSHPRQRRSASSRIMSSELGREDDDDEGNDGPLDPVEHVLHSPGGSDSSPEAEEAFIRQMQLVRGSVSTKMIASKRTLRSLENVKLEELSEADRSCVICYNEYGVETPEGINEAPLRLPKCGHIFGNHCIKKWFEDSDSCPYCRDKLHSEPKTQPGASARAFMNMMRARGINLQSGLAGGPNTEEAISRAYMATYGTSDRNAPPVRQSIPAGRRSPPREGNERQQRRLRPRHNSSNTRDTLPLPENRNHAVSFETPPQPVAVSLGLPSMQSEQIPTERQMYDWRVDFARTMNNASTTPQERGEESSLQNETLPPMLPPYPAQDLADQDPRVRTFRNPLQMPNGVPLVGPGNDETPPPVTFQNNRNRPW